ncbi:MAG: hypothetical protein KAS32_20205 [Candidatus Peribacteraceae bacterium]|nr:hypothetical protein [Candidatus Peribacteraceae bacterium]
MDLIVILYFLASYGITAIVVYSSLFKPLREWIGWSLLKCPMCFGFWVGLVLSFFVVDTSIEYFWSGILTKFLFACASSGITWILCSISVSGYAAKEFFNISAKQKLREELTLKVMEKGLNKKIREETDKKT